MLILCVDCDSGHFAGDEIKEKIDELDQKWHDFKVWIFLHMKQMHSCIYESYYMQMQNCIIKKMHNGA